MAFFSISVDESQCMKDESHKSFSIYARWNISFSPFSPISVERERFA